MREKKIAEHQEVEEGLRLASSPVEKRPSWGQLYSVRYFMPVTLSSVIRRGLTNASKSLEKSLVALASGKRLNSAVIDPAGIVISKGLAVTVTLSDQARRNVLDAVSASSIADGAASQLSDIGGRMAELATQAANGTLSDEQRGVINQEFQVLSQEAQRIVETTEFNGVKLLKGESIAVQAGTDSSSGGTIMMPGVEGKAITSAMAGLSVATQDGARAALDSVRSIMGSISFERGVQGASQRRLESAAASLFDKSLATEAARSRIEDTDVAEESANIAASGTRRKVAAALQKKYQMEGVESLLIRKATRKG